MRNREPIEIINDEEAVVLPSISLLGWTVRYSIDPTAPLVAVDREADLITVNQLKCGTQQEAQRVGILAAAREKATSELFRSVEPKIGSAFIAQEPKVLSTLLTLAGARLLGEQDGKLAAQVAKTAPPTATATGEFQAACAQFVLSGEFPPVTPAVKQALESLPVSGSGHVLTRMAAPDVTLDRKRDYYDRFIAPELDRLAEFDKALRSSISSEFQPSTDDSSEEELSEDDIEQSVSPFLGGYHREQVLDGVNWDAMTMQATGVPSARLLPSLFAEQSAGKATYTFSGRNGEKLSNAPLTIPLIANATVDPASLAAGFTLRQTSNGTCTLEWAGLGSPPSRYALTFTRSEFPHSWQTAEPTTAEQGIPDWVVQTLSDETRAFLGSLREANLTDTARVQQVVRRVQTMLTYVNDSAVGEALTAAGTEYFAELERLRKGDCDVSNFYALAQLRALGIPCRMVAGYFVRRDKRFSFAALAGSKHAWLEWWNSATGIWERADATPPSKEPSNDDEEGDGPAQTDMNLSDASDDQQVAPDETDNDPWSIPLTDDELEQLQDRLETIASDVTDSSETRAAEAFEQEYGVSQERWTEVLTLVQAIEQEKVPREATIDQRTDSTVGQEWEKIFNQLLIAYRVPDRPRRILGRQSQGGVLKEPVIAGIDTMQGDENPGGYEVVIAKERVAELPVRFDNDFLLDVTASMTAKVRSGRSLLDEQRRFVLSSLYEAYRLNVKVAMRQTELNPRPLITSHILSIHGGQVWKQILKGQPLTPAELAATNEALKQTAPGGGAMADALEAYRDTLRADSAIVQALRSGQMVKTLTIVTDGNMWCSLCQKEQCSYQLHGPSLQRVQQALRDLWSLGVNINAIGFGETSRPVTKVFARSGDPLAAVVVDNLAGALAAHHGQINRAMAPVLKVATQRTPGTTR